MVGPDSSGCLESFRGDYLRQIHRADIPAPDDEIVRVDHGQEAMEGHIHVRARLGVGAEPEGGAHDERAVVVGRLRALARRPAEAAAVGEDPGRDRGAVVAAPADQHYAHAAGAAADPEVVDGLLGRGYEPVREAPDRRGVVRVPAVDGVRRVVHVRRVDRYEVRLAGKSLSIMASAIERMPVLGCMGSHGNIVVCLSFSRAYKASNLSKSLWYVLPSRRRRAFAPVVRMVDAAV